MLKEEWNDRRMKYSQKGESTTTRGHQRSMEKTKIKSMGYRDEYVKVFQNKTRDPGIRLTKHLRKVQTRHP